MSEQRDAVPARALLIMVWVGLMVLLAMTAGSAYLPLGGLNVVINLGISVAKMLLVMAFYMHLRARGGLLRLVAASGIVWLLLLIGLSFSDYLTRVPRSAPW